MRYPFECPAHVNDMGAHVINLAPLTPAKICSTFMIPSTCTSAVMKHCQANTNNIIQKSVVFSKCNVFINSLSKHSGLKNPHVIKLGHLGRAQFGGPAILNRVESEIPQYYIK